MAVRVRFIYLLFIILIFSLVFVSCEECVNDLLGTQCPEDSPGGSPQSPCKSFEKECNGKCISIVVSCCSPFSDPSVEIPCTVDKPICCDGECIPIGVDCCRNQFSGDRFGCTESEPKCCFGGNCIPEEDLCPFVTECPEHIPQPCGTWCRDENDTCCTDFRSCPERLPICCPSGTIPSCTTSPDKCCQGTGCI